MKATNRLLSKNSRSWRPPATPPERAGARQARKSARQLPRRSAPSAWIWRAWARSKASLTSTQPIAKQTRFCRGDISKGYPKFRLCGGEIGQIQQKYPFCRGVWRLTTKHIVFAGVGKNTINRRHNALVPGWGAHGRSKASLMSTQPIAKKTVL